MSKVKWGSYLLPAEAAPEHFLFVGSTGSGKSVLIKMLMRSVLNNEALNQGTRAVVYDAKQDILPFLHGLVSPRQIKILHPFDERGWAWDIATDVASPLAARQIASILVPEPSQMAGADQFFNEAARELVMAAMIALMHSPKAEDWTLRDLLLLVLDEHDLNQALEQTNIHTAKRIQKRYLLNIDSRTKSNILATLSTKLGVYEPIAAAWETNPRRLSIREWSQGSSILVIGNDERARASLDPINRALFQRIAEETLGLPEQSRAVTEAGRARTWIFLDEFREAGKLNGLRSLLNKGRSKGACLVLGCQDIEGVRAVYGPHEGGELLSQCLHTVILNVGNPETAQWAANLFGAEDVLVESVGTSIGGHFNENQSEKLERKTLVTTRELVSMPRLNPQNGLSGYYKSPVLETSAALKDRSQYQRICPWRFGERQDFSWNNIAPLIESVSGVRPFEPKADNEQYLCAWTPQERQILGWDAEDPEVEPVEEPSQQRDALFPSMPVPQRPSAP